MTDPSPQVEQAPAPPRQRRGILWAIAIAAVLLSAGAVAALTVHPTPQPIKACEAWVSGQLVSPATARWSDETWSDGVVSGDVDSQNSFGALIRSHFECLMVADRDGWTVDHGYLS